jgi:hypothetical protein
LKKKNVRDARRADVEPWEEPAVLQQVKKPKRQKTKERERLQTIQIRNLKASKPKKVASPLKSGWHSADV